MLTIVKNPLLSIVCSAWLALFTVAGCASTQPVYSDAAMEQKTATGVAIKPSEVGRATTPSVEYIRIKMGRSIFLDPPEGNTDLYLRVRDTSGRDWGIPIEDVVAQEVTRNGFRVVRDASTAAYALNVNILFADEASAAEIAQLDETDYGQGIGGILGSALAGGAIGAGGAVLAGGDATGVAAGAAAGAVVGGVANVLYNQSRTELLQSQQETKFFSLVADVEIRERVKGGEVKRSGSTRTAAEQRAGSSADLVDNRDGQGEQVSRTEVETFSEESTWKRHRTRLTGKAKGKLVVFKDVEHDFAVKMAKSIGGLL